MEYTEGDWKKEGNSIRVFWRGCICTAPKVQGGGVSERMGNLDLIAQAPRMYEALKKIRSMTPETIIYDIANQALAEEK